MLPSIPAGAQTRDLAALRGQVRDSLGGAVKGAQVKLRNSSTGSERQAETNEQGEYVFVGLPLTGKYEISASAAQFKTAEQKGVELRAGVTATIDFTLDLSGTQSQVIVNGTAGEGVQTDSNQISERLDLPKIEETPVLNNRLTSLALLDSSVRPSLTTGDVFTNETLVVVNGGGRRQTTYSIDNTNADDSWGRQTIFTSIPFASVQEFTILTNSSSAEYGRNAGSAVNIVSKSGSNQFHGDFLGMGRPAFSEASAPLASSKAENTLAQGSGSLSGPLIHDRTYFLISAEHTDQSRDAVITSPQAPGIFTGNFGQTLFLARVDHELTAGNKLTFRANFDRFSDTNPQDGVSGNNLPSTARTFSRNTYAAAVTDTATFGASMINEARFQWQLASPITQFIPQAPGPQVAFAGFYTSGDSRFANLINHQYQEADTVSAVRGRHLLKGGFDLIQSSSGGFGQEFGSGFLDGQWAINNPAGCNYSAIAVATVISDLNTNPGGPPAQAVCSGAPPPLVASYTQSFGNQNYNIKETLWGVFVQDNW
ncbi:MAG: carboxypeptidase regulatory-like domain-containing protein, partial [Candidatus Acidiferrales bacterium]